MEAKTLHCQSCGATVASTDLRCPYCRSALATVACPNCFTLVSREAAHCPQCGTAVQEAALEHSEFHCPDCRQALTAITVAGVALDQCGKCGGLWVAQKAFEAIASSREGRADVLGSLPTQAPPPMHLETVRYRPCPQCGRLMNRYNYAHISGVVLDTCKDDGIWFDRNELGQVLKFIEGGGLERSRTRQCQELDQERRLAAAAAPPPSSAWGEPAEFHSGHDSLLGALESVVSLFLR